MAESTALSSIGIYLMYKDTTWKKFIDIKDCPDMGGTPEQIESTTLSDHMKTYVEGLQDTGTIEFTANYTKANYTKAIGLKGKADQEWALYIGDDGETPDGHNGVLYFTGPLSVMKSSVSTNAVQEMKLTITSGKEIKFAEEPRV